jgi:putative spermidine/putrescine transport system substrate-binding protein
MKLQSSWRDRRTQKPCQRESADAPDQRALPCQLCIQSANFVYNLSAHRADFPAISGGTQLADTARTQLVEGPMAKRRDMTRPGMTRRNMLIGGAATIGAGMVGMPRIARAETKELVVGGAAGMAGYMKEFVFPVVEKKLDIKILFEGTRSLVNLEKMRADKDAPKMSVVLMDDPVMLLAEAEGLLAKLTPSAIPNLAKIKPNAVHHDGIWANYQLPWAGVAFNKQKLQGVASYAALWDPANKGRVVLPSLQNTEGVWTMIAAAHLETGKPFQEAQFDVDAAFKKIKQLKPNLLTIYTNQPQAENLLEQGEAWLMGGQFSSYTLLRTAAGAPVDLAAPKEGIFAMPSGICLVKGCPNQQLAEAFIDAYLGPEIQSILVEKSFVLPTNPAAKVPAGLMPPGDPFMPDWEFMAKNRAAWVDRWDREMA